MIFSVSKTDIYHEIPLNSEMDIYCFFSAHNSVCLPTKVLLLAIRASLKQKKEVLLLQESTFPIDINKNLLWDGDDHWLWLPPRASSLISKAWKNSEVSGSSFKILINNFKSLKSG